MTKKQSISPRLSRRLWRGVIYVLAGIFIIAGNRFGWFAPESSKQNNSGFEPIQIESNQSSQQFENQNIQTLRLEDPKVRGETHAVRNDMVTVNTRTHQRSNDNQKILSLFQAKRSDEWVTAYGRVARVLADDNQGSRHQRFLMDIGYEKWLLIAHNIDLAPYVPLKQGDEIIVHGEYEYNAKGGVIHWTHHDPRGYKEGGYIELNNKRYE